MAHLGSFGAALRELNPSAEHDTFEFFGETFTVEAVLPPMLMFQLGAGLTGKVEETEAMGAMWEAWRTCLTKPEHEDAKPGGGVRTVPADESQFVKFYRLAVEKRADTESLLQVVMALYQAQAGRPTEEPFGSSPGQSTTSPSSSTSSSPWAQRGLTPVAEVLAG